MNGAEWEFNRKEEHFSEAVPSAGLFLSRASSHIHSHTHTRLIETCQEQGSEMSRNSPRMGGGLRVTGCSPVPPGLRQSGYGPRLKAALASFKLSPHK